MMIISIAFVTGFIYLPDGIQTYSEARGLDPNNVFDRVRLDELYSNPFLYLKWPFIASLVGSVGLLLYKVPGHGWLMLAQLIHKLTEPRR
ncbi:MAG TPA: hypothetical protein VF194_13210 [Ferrovibrio sp.]|uniref:hypothetical protein n=1 Tax=Ferrovibrio sp. TaxID=1917215 RepID=UPI002ECFF5D1